ncbi:MAG: PAS domain-containing protein [Mariprofundales bacterium]
MTIDFSLLDYVQEGVVILDRAGKVQFWNQKMALWTKKSAAEMVGLDIARQAPKLGEARYRNRMMAALDQMAPETFSAVIHHHLIPCPFVLNAATAYRSQDTMMRPLRVGNENLLFISVVDRTDHMANIMGLMQANARLERSVRLRRESDRVNTMLAAGMDNAAEAILVVDHKGRIEYANTMFYNMAQFTSPTVRNKLLGELLSVDQVGLLQQEIATAIASGEMWRGRVVIRRPDGSRFPVSVSAAPVRLRKGRKVSHAVIILNDITDYEVANHALQARKKHEAMLTMVAGISHDFNNLLSGMVGNTYLLRKSVCNDEKAKRRLTTVEDALSEAAAIIQDLMIYARGDELVQGVLPLTPFVKEWGKEVRGLLPDSVALKLEIEHNHFPAHVDVGLLQYALMAVAENAKDAVEGVDDPRIVISFKGVDGDALPSQMSDSCVLLTLSDNGCGISEENMLQVCDPFFSTKRLGSGLGLSVAHSSIEQHHGVLHIDSTEGVGTTVSIWLPLAE